MIDIKELEQLIKKIEMIIQVADSKSIIADDTEDFEKFDWDDEITEFEES